jgi:uncharacterized membrane protein HdeD (DUF308 family)
MSSFNRDMEIIQYNERRAIHDHWILFLVEGILIAILGVLAIGAPLVSTLVATKFLGWLFIIAAIIGFVGLFRAQDVPGFLWLLLGTILLVAIGVFLLWRPVAGMLALTLALAIYFGVQGITQIFLSLEHRRSLSSWGWVLASGIINIILAAIILAGWPETATWVIGLLVGINLLVYGVALAMTAITSSGEIEAPRMTVPR